MLRIALTLALGVAVFAGNARAADEPKKLEGTLTCTKCALKETDKCSTALVVKDGDKKITYYLIDKGNKEAYHPCTKDAQATVTGKVVEKDGKKMIEDPKVEVKK